MRDEEVEVKSLQDLAGILREASKVRVRLVVIGGYAVAAYTRGYRYTKDIDLVAHKVTVGRLKGLLNSLGYSIRDTIFGLAGEKKLSDGFIDLHISVGRVHDISTGKDYPVDSAFFREARRLDIKGFYSRESSLIAPVVDLRTLFLLKLMPVGRDKDAIDLLSLMLNRTNDLELKVIAARAKRADMVEHFLGRARDYARRLMEGGLEKLWFTETASRLPHVRRREMAKFLRKLVNVLRQP